jgi:hypothetical protein
MEKKDQLTETKSILRFALEKKESKIKSTNDGWLREMSNKEEREKDFRMPLLAVDG